MILYAIVKTLQGELFSNFCICFMIKLLYKSIPPQNKSHF